MHWPLHPFRKRSRMNWRNSLEVGLSTVATFVPKLVMFLLILIIGLLIAKAIAKAVDKVLERVGFDGAVERGGVRKALEKSRFDASDIVAKIVYYALVLSCSSLRSGCSAPIQSVTC